MQRKVTQPQTSRKEALLQDKLLQDALLQELTQKKQALENWEEQNRTSEAELVVPARETTSAPFLARPKTLRDCVQETLSSYFDHLEGQPVTHVYDMVLAEVEAPLLEAVMRYTQRNQCKAAEMLGLSRGTLRKKLKQYDLL